MMSCGIGFMEEQPERNERLPVMGVFFLPTSAPWSYEGSIASYSWPRGKRILQALSTLLGAASPGFITIVGITTSSL